MIEGSASVSLRRSDKFLKIGEEKKALREALKAARFMVDSDLPVLGLDIDGTITDDPTFFSILSMWWPGRVVVITYRLDFQKSIDDLNKFGICYDEVILSKDLDKSQEIIDHKVDVYIDDQDECFLNVPESVTILKIRNNGNTRHGRWLYSERTGSKID